jgi:predicted flavoprotein YhiN
LTYTVNGCYDNNQVYSGGVSLGVLDENLMSKDVPNLYFTGEVCNVDGVCGGYNLQWAWTSGKIVGGCL